MCSIPYRPSLYWNESQVVWSYEIVEADARHHQVSSPPVYSPALHPLMQSLQTTLANIDCEQELELAKLSRSTAPVSVKARVLAGINQRHHERRGPYAHQLAIFRQDIRSQAT